MFSLSRFGMPAPLAQRPNFDRKRSSTQEIEKVLRRRRLNSEKILN